VYSSVFDNHLDSASDSVTGSEGRFRMWKPSANWIHWSRNL
jgi:hypothetical protein